MLGGWQTGLLSREVKIDSTKSSHCLPEHSTMGTASTSYQDTFSLDEKQAGAGSCFRDERRHSSISQAKQIIHYTHLLSSETFFPLPFLPSLV